MGCTQRLTLSLFSLPFISLKQRTHSHHSWVTYIRNFSLKIILFSISITFVVWSVALLRKHNSVVIHHFIVEQNRGQNEMNFFLKSVLGKCSQMKLERWASGCAFIQHTFRSNNSLESLVTACSCFKTALCVQRVISSSNDFTSSVVESFLLVA